MISLEIILQDNTAIQMPVCDFHLDPHPDAGIWYARFLNCNEDVIVGTDWKKIKEIHEWYNHDDNDEMNNKLRQMIKELFGERFISLSPVAVTNELYEEPEQTCTEL